MPPKGSKAPKSLYKTLKDDGYLEGLTSRERKALYARLVTGRAPFPSPQPRSSKNQKVNHGTATKDFAYAADTGGDKIMGDRTTKGADTDGGVVNGSRKPSRKKTKLK